MNTPNQYETKDNFISCFAGDLSHFVGYFKTSLPAVRKVHSKTWSQNDFVALKFDEQHANTLTSCSPPDFRFFSFFFKLFCCFLTSPTHQNHKYCVINWGKIKGP